MKTHSICHFYVNLILLVVGEYLKSILLQPTRGLFVLFNISRILAQDSTRSWLLLQPLKPLKNTKCLVKNGEPQFFFSTAIDVERSKPSVEPSVEKYLEVLHSVF